jgi:tRNA threonylcarbamoyladenosine biosynthesis protein TsaE
MIEIHCPTESDTRAVARKLAACLAPGDVVVLAGGLGAGKTLFTSGVAAGLGIDEPVVSPSFVLVRRYDSGFLPLVHVDVYRLSSANEFDDLDVFGMASDGVLVIEWGDAVESLLPREHLRVMFEVGSDESRDLRIVGTSAWAERGLEGLL